MYDNNMHGESIKVIIVHC